MDGEASAKQLPPPRGSPGAAHVRSLDHLCRLQQQGFRDCETEGSCGLEIDCEREPGRVFKWQFGWIRPFQDTSDQSRRALEAAAQVGTVGHEAAVANEKSELVDGGQE